MPNLKTKNNWTEKYNCHKVQVGCISINISWKSEGFKVTVAGRTLKQQFEEIEPAKQEALVFARKLLTQSLSEIYLDFSTEG